jgi:hypothetical protein
MKRPLINILTRTHRKECFMKCEESISSQSYKNYRHILCIDDESSLKYINSTDYIKVKRTKKKNFKHFPYNLYLNEMYKKIDNGWIMFLDDDDCFHTTDSLEIIASHIESEDDRDVLFLWKVRIPTQNRTVPSNSGFAKKPQMGNITTQGFCFHSRHVACAQWDNERCSDFRVVDSLYNSLPTIKWIDEILTAMQTGPGSLN